MKKIIIGISALFVVVISVIIVGLLSIKSIVTRDFIVKQLETSLNVRADLRQININLFSALSSIELEDLSLYKRDNFADEAKELSERTSLSESNSIISIKKIELKLNFLALIQRKFQVKSFTLMQPVVQLILNDNTNNISNLFQKPKIVEGKPNPALTETDKQKDTETKEDDKPFSIQTIPIAADIDKVGIENGQINILIQKTLQKIAIKNLTLLLTHIDIDPANLEKHNSISLKFDLTTSVIDSAEKETALFKIISNGAIVPFVAKTGYINPSVNYYLTLLQGSYIDGLSILDALSGKLPMLAESGIHLDSLSKKAELLHNVDIALNYSNHRITFMKEVVFGTANYDLSLDTGSWLNITTNEHSFKGAVLASKQESDKAVSGIDSFIQSKIKQGNPIEIRNKLLGNLLKGDRINLPFISNGNIKSANVQLAVTLPSVLELTKGIMGDILKNEVNKRLPTEAKDIINNGLKKLF